MRAGSLTDIVCIERPIATRDSVTNEEISSWEVWRSAWASVSYGRGAERLEGSVRIAVSSVKFTVRFEDANGVDVTMRIVFEGGYYDVINVMPDYTDRRYIVIETVIEPPGHRQ
jgi:head-tail adaptor